MHPSFRTSMVFEATPAFHAAGAAMLHELLNLLDLLRREHTARGEQCFHVLLFHLSPQRIHLIKLLHDGIVIRIIGPQKFTEFNVAQFQICAGLHG